VISGNFAGIDIFNAAGNRVLGNHIGTDLSGTVAVGNRFNGVDIFGTAATANVVGGTVVGARNIISGNGGLGVIIEFAGGNRVLGNYIGTDAAGTHALGNAEGVISEDVQATLFA